MELMTVTQYAKYKGLSHQRMYAIIKAGRIKVKTIAGVRFIDKDSEPIKGRKK